MSNTIVPKKADAPSKPRRTYRAQGREDQKRETGRRILECALQQFSERGFEASSLRDISAAAGVTHAVIRLHYGSKDDLWRAAICEMFDRQDDEINFAQLAKIDRLTRDDFHQLIHRYVLYCARHPEHIRIMIHETLRDSGRVEWLVDHHIMRVQAPLRRLLVRAMEDGIVKRMPLPSLMYILTAAAQTMFALKAEAKHLYGIEVNSPAVVQAHAEAICAVLLNG